MYLEISDTTIAICTGICDANNIPYENEAEAIELVVSCIHIPSPPPPRRIEDVDDTSLNESIEEEIKKMEKAHIDELLKGVLR